MSSEVPPPMPARGTVLLYDGGCGLCTGSVQLVLRHDRVGTLLFAALDSDFGRATIERHPELRGVDSFVWFEPAVAGQAERIVVRSNAALRVARYLGGWWRCALVAHAIPRRLRDVAYDLIARHRHRLWGEADRCLPSTQGQPGRFLR